jgi:glycosidase
MKGLARSSMWLIALLFVTLQAHALGWVGNTRLFLTGVGQLPSRDALIENGQTVSVTTQTWPIEAGQRVVAVITTDHWQTTQEYDFSFDFNVGNNTQWFVVLGPYPKGTDLQFYIRAQRGTEVVYDNNGGQSFGFFTRYAPNYRTSPILQWFQTDYKSIMLRLPEVAMAGYGAIYLPGPTKSGGGGLSTGYNPFDRFDLGDRLQKGTVRTQYGTTQELMELIRLAHRFGIEVYCDMIPNHNDNRSSTAIDRYPDMIPEDFHIRSSADTGNTEIDFNNAPPFGFTTLNHDIVGLVDIAHENGNNTRTGAFNLPSYASFNVWDKPSFIRHPLNPHYYSDGAPYTEDVRQYLKRWGWFMTSVIGFDGYRIDAVRHTTPAFFARVSGQPGSTVSQGDFLPYLYSLSPQLYVFGEDYTSNSWELREYAKTGMNLLDFPMKFMTANLFNANGFGNLGASLSNGYGLDSSTGLPYELGGLAAHVGVGFVQSHDDGPPRSNNLAYAWLLTRPGRPKVYYDGNNIQPDNWSHFPKPGRYDSLGAGGNATLHMLDVRSRFARGNLVNRWVSNDLYIYERQVDGKGLLLVGLNDRGDLTSLSATVQTAFSPGTALIDYSGQRPPVTVATNGTVSIIVPPNSAPGNNNNAHGYVFYAPATPQPLQNERVIQIRDLQGNPLSFQTYNLPGGTYATRRTFEAATVTEDTIHFQAQTDSTGFSAAIKLDNGLPIAGREPLQNTPEGLTDGYVLMDKIENGHFVLNGASLTQLPEGLHIVRVRVFMDTPGRPGLFSEFTAFFYLNRPDTGLNIDGSLTEYGTPLSSQTRPPSSNNNRLDALYVRNDYQYLYIGLAGRVDTAENLTNGIAMFIDVDYGAGTGVRNLNLLDDDSGPATRLLSNAQVTAPTGFGAELGIGLFRHSPLHSSPEASFTGDAIEPPFVGAQTGLYRITPGRLNRLTGEPARIAWLPRLNVNDPASGAEIAIPLNRLYAPGEKAGRPIGLIAYLLNTGETGNTLPASDPRRGIWGGRTPATSWVSNQFLPPQPNIITNPNFTPVTLQTVATYSLQPASVVSSPYRIVTTRPLRYDRRINAYVMEGYVISLGTTVLPGPLFLWMRLPAGTELLNRTGISLLEQNAAYLQLTSAPLLPLSLVPFQLQFRAPNGRNLPPKMELRTGDGAL